MLLLMAGSMGIMNMVPWGGPLGRASAVTGIEASILWQNIIPVQIVGIIGMMAFAAIMGLREKKRIQAAAINGTTPFEQDCTLSDLAEDTDDGEARKPKNFWFNIALILISIICLAFGLFSAPYVFMIALSLVLLVNFPRPRQQVEVISRHAPQALNMVAIIFAAGAFLGILSESGMLKAIALDLIHILPPTWVGSLHIAVGLLGVPLDIFTSTDAYYFALLPVIGEVTATAWCIY